METDKPDSSSRVYVADWWADLEEEYVSESDSGGDQVALPAGQGSAPVAFASLKFMYLMKMIC